MTRETCENAPLGLTHLASIDVGSHTARLLVVQKMGTPELFRPLLRKRAYIRLAQDFQLHGKGSLHPEAIERTLNALEDFAAAARRFRVESTLAVSTGVVREASNREEFLGIIEQRTGIKVRAISGDEEARLTEQGVMRALKMGNRPSVIFDLGGGSTEFIYGEQAARKFSSVPLGVMLLTQRYLSADPPRKEKLRAAANEVDRLLKNALSECSHLGNGRLVVGTGGTVTTLAAMVHGVEIREISPERMNGLTLHRERLEDLFLHLKTMRIEERLKLPGLDRGRADVIVAGCMTVIRILHFFDSPHMVVCLSDLLEGILIEYLEGV